MKNINYNENLVKNSSLIKKQLLIALVIILLFSVSYVLVFYWGYRTSKNEISVEIFNSEEDFQSVIASYVLDEELGIELDAEKAVYITQLSKAMGVDPDLAVAILKQENPTVNVKALNENENGTCDIGMWQLNDKYLYKTFVKSFWHFDIEFNVSNWKHNTYIALSLIKDLSKEFDNPIDIAMAYNCGRYRVKINKGIPLKTISYGENVSKTLEYLQNKKSML